MKPDACGCKVKKERTGRVEREVIIMCATHESEWRERHEAASALPWAQDQRESKEIES